MNLHIKKTQDYHKLEDRFQKKAIFQSHIPEIADKKTAYKEGCLYIKMYWVDICLDMFSLEKDRTSLKFWVEIHKTSYANF
jgi:hypothetical protein